MAPKASAARKDRAADPQAGEGHRHTAGRAIEAPENQISTQRRSFAVRGPARGPLRQR